MVEGKSIPSLTRKRIDEHEFETISPALQEQYEAEGWVLHKTLKKSVKMKRPKAHDVAFEDRVWAAFATLGFPHLNRDRKCVIPYGPGKNQSKQIDVFAADDEVVLVVECKSAATPKRSAFKSEVEAIQGIREGVVRSIRQEFTGHKIRFVLATNNFSVSEETIERIEGADIVHFNESDVDYYLDLAKHLGKAARYQLLGRLFSGQKIENLGTSVAAIQGKMGGMRYYAFMIEPARLLKLAYILHRDKANRGMMPTYQRLIKKSRLQKVADFVDDGGYFPNSIVLSIDAGKKAPRFDRAGKSGTGPAMGILHLPQVFRSAYVIDGQHRLYGYAGTDKAETELIPVVAFVNLPREDQVRLFMEINENQKAVPKNLRNTLNADLLWNADDYSQRAKALRLKIAQELEEERTSPLSGRIILGEDRANDLRCITIDALNRGIDRGRFVGVFTKSEMKEAGSFYRGDSDSTFKSLSEFLLLCFQGLKEGLEQQYALGRAEGGFVFINTGVESFLRLVGDVVDHLAEHEGLNPKAMSPDSVYEEVRPYIVSLCMALNELPREEALELRRGYGSGGTTKYWRKLQALLAGKVGDFEPDGLREYQEEQEKQFNKEAFEITGEIETFLKEDIRQRLEDEFGARWLKDGVPRKVYLNASNLANEKNLELEKDEEVEPWDCLHLIDYKEILQYKHDHWVELFEQRYTRPQDEDKKGGWKAKSDWLAELNRIRNGIAHDYVVSQEDYDFLISVKTWLDL
jgi:DNA sulfur modification protein DndB